MDDGGLQHEPVYPDGSERARPGATACSPAFRWVDGADDPDEERKRPRRPWRAATAGARWPVELEPGDVAFFTGRTLHRSHRQSLGHAPAAQLRRPLLQRALVRARGTTRLRPRPRREAANHRHILARGATHMPHARPRFGTAVELD
jgi:hypothetical protein